MLAPALMPTAPTTRVFHEAGQRLTLRNYGSHYELMIGRVPLLTSKALGTERAFGELAGPLSTRPAPRVLVGGLGFGATLGGALRAVGRAAEVLVVEKLTTVINLCRGELAHLERGVLDDPRVRLIQDDVCAVIERERDLDVILLDVDNGPDWASFKSNARLYGAGGLEAAQKALRPGGAYAVWSGYAADGFLKHLRRCGFEPKLIPLRERNKVRARAYVGVTKKRSPEP
jgi:spermidine synthase